MPNWSDTKLWTTVRRRIELVCSQADGADANRRSQRGRNGAEVHDRPVPGGTGRSFGQAGSRVGGGIDAEHDDSWQPAARAFLGAGRELSLVSALTHARGEITALSRCG
jgi:hypothetical protein